MSRTEALRKLLAIGELHRSEIDDAMGGDKSEITHALAELMRSGEVRMVSSGYGVQVCRLTDTARVRAFSDPIEVTVLVRQRVQIINFTEVSPC